jgi:transcriptional regulator with XRE-family HTH domain
MNERERMICARIKEFRERVNWSQKDFAAQIGISLNQLASIEYARTPLRYDIAWKIRSLFGVGLEWLSVGELTPDSTGSDDLPPPESTGLNDSALLSEVSDKINGSVPEISYSKRKVKKIKLDKDELSHRAFVAYALRQQIDVWIAKVPDGYTSDFSDKFFQLAKVYLKALPEEPFSTIEARLDALLWDKMRRELRGRLHIGSGTAKSDLTNPATSVKPDDVKAQLPSLLARLNRETSETGRMSALAKFLGVPLASVSRWLSGKREPGGEITLRLLHWVEQQERQK